MNVIFKYSLSIFFTFFMLDSLICQTNDAIKQKFKFVDESNNPIPNIPIDIGYSGAPRTVRYVTHETGEIEVPLFFTPNFPNTDTTLGCFIDVVYEGYERFFQVFSLHNDSLKNDITITYQLKKIPISESISGEFNNLSALISLEDFVIKDTIYLYQTSDLSVPQGVKSIQLTKLLDEIYKLDLYSRDLSTYQLSKAEKLIKVNSYDTSISITIDSIELEFYIKTLMTPLQFGYSFRYMLIRK